jgi:hypothetical protein
MKSARDFYAISPCESIGIQSDAKSFADGKRHLRTLRQDVRARGRA